MTTVGPVCHIPPTTTVTNQPAPQQLPSIPAASPTIASLMETVNRMRSVINYITGRQGPEGPQGRAGTAAQPAKPPKPPRWSEVSRTESTQRIYQNNDHTSSNYVDVKSINQLKMRDSVTGEGWTWDRDRR